MPGLMEAEDDGLYVVKFRGAGQGPKALVAEVLAGELGRGLGLGVPDVALVDVDPELARAEPDPEVQDLIRASAGINFGVDFLPGALTFDPASDPAPDADLAASLVWLDALVMNVDRTPRNPNLLVWHGRLWPIDHGAAFYQQHGDWHPEEDWARPFPAIRDHVLLPYAGPIADVDERLAAELDDPTLAAIVDLVPEEWLAGRRRAEYLEWLARRLRAPRGFAEEAERARTGA
ncbi:MAG: hypothetical protein QOJ07_3528 [Thermoleophilaceae bacterium]|nr:hypothetical protein [Thermoleophilaceae bacterium]